MITGTAWPHLLADLKEKRAAIDQVIDLLETHFTRDAESAEDQLRSIARARRGGKPGPKPGGRRALKKRTNERTNEQKARRSEPP